MDRYEQADEVLQHFGVKGMKWGVRRYQKKSSSGKKSIPRRYVEEAINSAKAGTRNNINTIKHPIIATKEQLKFVAKKPRLVYNSKDMNLIGDNIDRRVAAKKKQKAMEARNNKISKGIDPDDPRGRVRKEIDSLKRENKWKEKASHISKMDEPSIKKLAERIGLENDLRKLTKRNTYLSRDRMKTPELKAKVARLRLEETLSKQIKESSKVQDTIGRMIVQGGSKVYIGKKLGSEDSYGKLLYNEANKQYSDNKKVFKKNKK